jgi:hypothetical protein
MSQTQEDAQRDPGDARIIQQQRIAGSHGEEEIEGPDDRGRRWYHLRPEPRRRADVMGFSATWWALLWLVLIVVLLEPWWW